MSKIGRKPIDLKDTQVEVNGQEINYKGKKATGSFKLTSDFSAELKDSKLYITPKNKDVSRDENMLWGMSRALLANKINGAAQLFEKQLQINGLGFKAALSGKKIDFTLGFSHKISLELPKDVTLEIDKTGQLLTFKSPDKEELGAICDRVRSLRPPEPYKGTGVKLTTETIIRKAGKTKAAA